MGPVRRSAGSGAGIAGSPECVGETAGGTPRSVPVCESDGGSGTAPGGGTGSENLPVVDGFTGGPAGAKPAGTPTGGGSWIRGKLPVTGARSAAGSGSRGRCGNGRTLDGSCEESFAGGPSGRARLR